MGRNCGHNRNSCCHTNRPSIQFECFIQWNFCRRINFSISYFRLKLKANPKINVNFAFQSFLSVVLNQREREIEEKRTKEDRMIYECERWISFIQCIDSVSILMTRLWDKKKIAHFTHKNTHKFYRFLPIHKSDQMARIKCNTNTNTKSVSHSHIVWLSKQWLDAALWFKACGNVCTQFSLIILFFNVAISHLSPY